MQGPNDSEKLQSDLNVHQKWEKSGIWSLIHPSVKSCTLRDLVTLSGTIIPCTDRPLNRLRMLGIEASTYPGISSVSLGFPHHINRITSNAQKTLVFSMKRNIKTTNSGIREAAYKTIVRPQIEYAFTTWSSYTKKKKKKKTYTRLRWYRGGRSFGYVIRTQTTTVFLPCSQISVSGHWSRGGLMQVSSCFIK